MEKSSPQPKKSSKPASTKKPVTSASAPRKAKTVTTASTAKPSTPKSSTPKPKPTQKPIAKAPAKALVSTAPVAVKRPTRRKFDYDVCLSFAGEDRVRVEKIKNRLVAKDIKVFYDTDEQADLWGKDLYAHLADIYANKARFCVIFVSKHYARKHWTNHERLSAQSRAFLDNGADYILYVKIDDTELPGLLPTTGYVTMQKHGVVGIAKLIEQKVVKTRLAKKTGTPIPTAPKKTASQSRKMRVGLAKNFSCSSRVSVSADWILLDGWFYKGKVTSGGGKLRLTIAASAQQEARLNALDPHNPAQSHRRLSYAHRSDASWCQVEKVTSVSSGSKITFEVTLNLQGFGGHHGFYDADAAQAKIASALLLHDSSTKNSTQTASYFGFQARSQSPFADFWQRVQEQQWPALDLLRCARLQAIFHLLSNGLIQEVAELSLGPVSKGILTVKFVGKFSSPYSGQKPNSVPVAGKASFDV